jgi:hypothetical protein
MQAIIYLIKRQYINKIKRAFSSVVSIVITILAVLGFGISFVMAFRLNRPIVDRIAAETILAGVLLMIGVIIYNSFLARDNGILTMADANFLFTGPFEKKTVLAYILIASAPASILTGFFMCFYFPFLLGPVLTVSKFLVVLLIISLLFGCIFLSYYYLYVVDVDKPGLKKKVRKIFFAFLGVLVFVFIILLVNTGFNVKDTAQKFFTNSWYNWVPLFGWAKWAISSLLNGNIIYGFIPATALLVITNTVLCLALYNVKSDFYEKTLEDSANLQKLLDEIKTNGSADVRSVAKLKKKASPIRFNQGAAAIYSRQMLESNKLNLVSKCRELFLGLFYIAFGAIFGLEFNFILLMIGFGALSMSLNDSWHRDFKKPYVFLIPASSFSKVIYSVLPGLIKTLISGSITITIGALVYRVNPVNIISYILIFASFVVLFIFAEVLTYRLIGSGSSVMAVTFMRMFFAMGTCIPAGIVLVIIIGLSNGIPNMLVIAACMLLINVASSALLAYLSRGIFEKSEVMG